jgi:hypothetical protein
VSAFGLVQLNLVWEPSPYGVTVQGSLMELTSPMRAEFFPGLPYSARANLPLLRYMLPAMLVLQVFFPGSERDASLMSLRESGWLHVEGKPNRLDLAGMRKLLGLLRWMGALSSPRLIVRVPSGHATHYSSSLPMRESPSHYECDRFGRLGGTRGVYVADSAAFTGLPAKNMSFGMMAHAMRVAAAATRRLPETT